MSEQTVFLVKTGLAGLEEIEVDGHLALDDYETFSSTIRRQLGADTASLFAEPIVTRSRDRESGSVAWYTSRRGQPRRLVECDSQERAAAEALLRTRLDDVAGLLDDPGIGPRLGAWLHFPSLEDVWVVGGQPVLTNWGMLPVGVARDGDQRAEHYASTMAVLGGPAVAPALGLSEWRARPQPESQPPELPPNNPADVGAASPATAVAATHVLVEEQRRGSRWPLLTACALALLALLILLIPGVLHYPLAPETNAALNNPEALELQREINRSLEDQIGRLQRELGTASCTPETGLNTPDGTGALPLLPPSELALPQTQPAPPSAGSDAAEESTEEGQTGTTPAETTDIETLQDLIDASVVLVIAPTEGGGMSTGTGFFVGPKTIVTNRHVIENAGAVFVVNEFLGSPIQVQVGAKTATSQIGSPDFAILEGDFPKSPPPISVSDSIDKLEDVVAPGFPGIIIRTDTNFLELMRSGEGDPPNVAAQSGTVTVIQNYVQGGSRVIIHSADISPGNSGGPLLDACGRAVGVNTFVNPDQDGTFRRLNYSLHAEVLEKFLKERGIAHGFSSDACQPRRRAPPAEVAGEPEPAPEDAAGAPAEMGTEP